MYGLTDNIVAGPAGHTEAGPAGHIEAGPAGHVETGPVGGFTPAGAGQTTPAPAGWVPIANVPAEIPYAPGGGGPVPGGGTFTPEPAGGGTPMPGGYSASGRAGGGDTIGGAILGALAGGGGGVPGGGLSAGGAASGGGAFPGGGGGPVPGGGASAVGASSGGGVVPGGGSSAAGAFSGGGTPGPGAAGFGAGGLIGGGGVVYSVSSGAGAAPAERAGGILLSQPGAGGTPGEAGSIGFVLGQAGHTVASPTGYVHPPMASHFHGHATPRVAHQPTHVFQHTVTSEAWQGYRAAYVWPGPPEILPLLDMLADGHVDPGTYQLPHVVFSDEKPGPKSTVDASVGASRMQVTEVLSQTTTQDYSQQRTVQNQTVAVDKSSVTLDNSSTHETTVSMPQQREVALGIDDSRTVNVDLRSATQHVTNLENQEGARVLNMFLLDAGPAPAALSMGAPLVARVA